MNLTLLRGAPLAIAALVHVIEKPEIWRQDKAPYTNTKCGCFLHLAIRLSGHKIPRFGTGDGYLVKSQQLLEIGYRNAVCLFDRENTLSDLKHFVKEIFGIKQVKLTNGEIVKL
jgi:hypothetical protein